MFWNDIVDGDSVQAILPPKVRGEGANVFDSSEFTDGDVGTVVKTGTSTSVTLGYYVGPSESATFVAYDAGVMAGDDIVVNHGKGVRLAVSVVGAVSLRIGYAGTSS